MKQFGTPVPDWVAPRRPDFDVLEGRYVRLESLDVEEHSTDLFRANSADDGIWDYLPYGPFPTLEPYRKWVEAHARQDDPRFYVLRDIQTGQCGGVTSYLRIIPKAGSIELGHINLSKELQGTRVATEAFFLMMNWAFNAGYRRFEWKCDALNMGSRRAAQRLGLSFEGIFRQAVVVKGRNRDTAWFAAIDAEWPALKTAFETWLEPENFSTAGQQQQRLSDLTRPIRVTSDPALD